MEFSLPSRHKPNVATTTDWSAQQPFQIKYCPGQITYSLSVSCQHGFIQVEDDVSAASESSIDSTGVTAGDSMLSMSLGGQPAMGAPRIVCTNMTFKASDVDAVAEGERMLIISLKNQTAVYFRGFDTQACTTVAYKEFTQMLIHATGV